MEQMRYQTEDDLCGVIKTTGLYGLGRNFPGSFLFPKINSHSFLIHAEKNLSHKILFVRQKAADECAYIFLKWNLQDVMTKKRANLIDRGGSMHET